MLLLGDIALQLVRIYADVLSLAGLVLVRLPYELCMAPLRLLFPQRFQPRIKQFRNVFITGASVGIGAGLAKAFAAPGVKMYITALTQQGLMETKLACEQLGAKVTCILVDVRDSAQMELEIYKAHSNGPLDLVIANAGISSKENGLKETRLVLETNVMGMANTIVPALELMLQEKRSSEGYFPQLVLMSSLGGLVHAGSMFMTPYVASKSAIRMYGESLRTVFGDKNIGVTVIAPGMTESRMVQQQIDAGIKMTTGVWPLSRAVQLMKRGICENRGEIAYPFAWFAIAKTFGGMPTWLKDVMAPMSRVNDPYHAADRF